MSNHVSIRVGDEVAFTPYYTDDDMIVSETTPFEYGDHLDALDRNFGRQDIDSYHASRSHNYKLAIGEIGIVTYIYVDAYQNPRLHVRMSNGKEIDTSLNRTLTVKKNELWY